MAKQEVDIGIEGNDNTGDSIRESFRKVNENFSELYAVFGIGGQISFTDLSDVPNSYIDQENKVPVVRSNATGLDFLELASNSDVDPNDVDTITFDYSVEGKLVLKVGSTSVENDPFPALGGPLNANVKSIGNIAEVNQASADNFNSIHGTNISVGDLVIDKKYGDANYQEKQRAGSGIRLNSEPVDNSDYIKTIDSFDSFGNAVITDHGYGNEFLGAPFIFNTTGTAPTNLTDGQTVYLRVLDDDTISFHTTETNAINNTGRIIMNGGSGVLTITDSDYDETLEGNWLSTVALPRESVTRRQGDRMEGALFLHDHPGDLAGLGTDIGGTDDLQAATKLYVDKGTPTSQVNLYVSTFGDDEQQFTPPGKEGRSESWAYASVRAACEKAEEIIESSPYETGPYRQTMFVGGGSAAATIETAGVASPPVSRNNFSTLISENVEFIKAEVIAFIAATYPDFEYDELTCARDVEYIVNSVRLDILLGNNANYLSRWSGIRYYSNPSARKAIGEQRTETVASIEHTQKLVRDIVKGIAVGSNDSVAGTKYQTRETQYIEPALIPDEATAETVADATDAKFAIILGVIEDGPLEAPTIVDGGTTYKLNVGNGNNGFIDQGNPTNTDIIPGKVIIGKNSGARARIIAYRYEADPETTVSIAETDEFEVQLLEPIEFENGEELEYGNLVRETQITIKVESGIYEEDYPIRVPANVSIKGDEFRRVIVRPKKRVSQSRYTNTFFYRDAEFDGLVPISSSVLGLTEVRNGAADVTRAAAVGTYTGVTQTTVTTVDPITGVVTVSEGTSGAGTGATFDITVNADGSVTVGDIDITDGGTSYLVGDTITISDDDIGATGADDLVLVVDEISGGKPYVNPLTNNIDGYFGYHYLRDPNKPRSLLLSGYNNTEKRPTAAAIMRDNKEFIQEQVVEYIDINFPAVVYSPTKCARDVGLIVEAMASDFEKGGLENILEAQGEYYFGALPKDGSQTAATIAGIEWIHTIASDILTGTQPSVIWGTGLEHPQADLFNGEAEAGAVALSNNFIETINYAFNENYNPPLRNDDMDVFLMNDASLLRNMTVQGHGGFMLVLDPYGQVLTKSPYVQTGSSFSRSLNKQVFAGGLFVDAFAGNSAMSVESKDDAFTLNVQSLGSQSDPQGLFIRRPQTPCPFYIDGRRFQVNAIKNYDPDEGTATLLLDRNSNDGDGFTGVTSALDTGVDLDDLASPIPLTLQTGGNRSILGNDFTQVNDQGYGLIAVNGALSEMVSMFTYYCWASYYARNGSEIRSLTGSSCYGEYGLVAEGSDPNEIPDGIELRDDMANPAKAFSVEVVLTTSDNITVVEGETLTQAGTGATGVVTTSTNTRTVYLTSVTDIFNTVGELTGSTSGALGASSVPAEVDTAGYTNDEEQLFAHLYDFEYLPSNRSEFDVYHPVKDIFARYEIANIVDTGLVVGEVQGFGDSIAVTYNAVSLGAGTGATFKAKKTITDGYTVTGILKGEDYEVGDEIVISGIDMGGASPANDVTIEVTEIDSNGGINTFTTSGTIAITADTPRFNGKIIKANFGTGDAQFSQDGILETGGIAHDTYVQVRNNQTFVFEDIARPDILTIRPSTAVIFRENPDYVYRSISFLTADTLGNELPETNSLAGFDSTYDYIRLVVNTVNAQNTVGTVLDLAGDPLTGGTTLGNTAGDTTIAVNRIFEANELRRLNNNLLTESDFRPQDFDGTGELAMITSWDGKKHTVFNYRGVKIDPDTGDHEIQSSPSETDDYGIVTIADLSDIEYPARPAGLASTLVLGTVSPILRTGLQNGSPGTVTIAISTCRATGHDFLDVGTGGFNSSNYPNVIFGLPRAPDQSNEVQERGKGRVFYVSTDQNGIFRVGRFFSVDQGTGTVSFSASIALSDVDGLGFKRGIVVTEFSTDTAMTDNASDTVPTESAVRGYVNRRLGFDQTGAAISNKIGPGVLAPNGSVPMTADLNAAGSTITNLATPSSLSDAATKAYVDDSRGANDTLPDLRDIELQDYTEGQLLVSTGEQKIIISAGSVVGGPFQPGQTITGSLSGAEGVIVDVVESISYEGNIIEITYTPVSGTFSSGPPTGQDVVEVLGSAEGTAIDGPVSVWANGVYSSDSDIQITTNRIVTLDGSGDPTDRYTEVSVQLVSGAIENADVSATAGIVQSKLDLNAATTRANATGITQGDLGVASFDDTRFTATDGWIKIKDNGIQVGDIQQLTTKTVIGNSTAGLDTPTAVPFATVVTDGGGLADTDFEAASEILAASDPGQALVKTGAGTYGITNVTKTGEPNSIVKTDASGSIQVNSLILGGDSNYEILSLDTTELVFKTPGQGTILTASGGSPGTGGSPSDPGYIAPTFPTLEIPGSINISGTGISESFLQQSSPLNGEKVLAVDWIYSSFIEAPGEKGNASTGLSIGANTGKTTAGQVGIIVADSATNSSVAPFVFSSTGVIPDINNVYNVGSSTRRYNTMYATVFNGTATEAFYADLAENYLGDAAYEPGTVLVLGGKEEVTTTDKKGDRRVAGVVTTNPAHLMNSHLKGDHVIGIALQGRVPCKVLGKVEKGDILVTSAIPGYAIVDNDPKAGTIIGKALSNKLDSDKGIVEVVVGKH